MSKSSRAADRSAGDPRQPSVAGHAVRRYALGSLLALVVLAVGAVHMSQRIAQDEAIRDARVTAGAIARGLVGPQLDLSDPGSTAPNSALERLMRHRLLGGSLTHMKIWEPSGRLVWSDESGLAGHDYTLPASVQALFGTRGSVADLPDEDKPAEGGEADEGDLLEVYVGAQDVSGAPFVFETYTPRQRLAANTHVIFVELVPIGLLALLLFSAITLPLAMSLARNVDRGQRRRSEILRHSLDAWSRERRRLAQGLHDGVVQDLAAVGYAVHFLLEELPPSADRARATGVRATELLTRATTSLRDVVGDLLPSESADEDLATALSGLALGAKEDGVEVVVDVDPHAAWERDVVRFVYWVVREGLVNVVKHAHASAAKVTVRSSGDQVEVQVADNGRGPADGPVDGDQHVGLRLLEQSLDEVGGRVEAGAGDGGGFVLTASLPTVLLDRTFEGADGR